ncbi:MAG: hypothetical protein WDW38_007511 [Sanguina aurantia]
MLGSQRRWENQDVVMMAQQLTTLQRCMSFLCHRHRIGCRSAANDTATMCRSNATDTASDCRPAATDTATMYVVPTPPTPHRMSLRSHRHCNDVSFQRHRHRIGLSPRSQRHCNDVCRSNATDTASDCRPAATDTATMYVVPTPPTPHRMSLRSHRHCNDVCRSNATDTASDVAPQPPTLQRCMSFLCHRHRIGCRSAATDTATMYVVPVPPTPHRMSLRSQRHCNDVSFQRHRHRIGLSPRSHRHCNDEALMRHQRLSSSSYALFSRADEGITAINKWMRLADYPSLWVQQGVLPPATAASTTKAKSLQSFTQRALLLPYKESGSSTSAMGGDSSMTSPAEDESSPPLLQPLRGAAAGGRTLEELLSRKTRHVDNCVICQKGERDVTNMFYAFVAIAAVSCLATLASAVSYAASSAATAASLSAAAAAAAVCSSPSTAAAAAAAASVGFVLPGWVGVVALAAVSGAAILASVRLWELKTERFVTGIHAWRKKGATP